MTASALPGPVGDPVDTAPAGRVAVHAVPPMPVLSAAEAAARWAQTPDTRSPAPEPQAAPAAHSTILTLRGVTKTFGETVAVADVDLTVSRGTFYGLVGPNGAGKTTTLSLIAGLLQPDAGTIVLDGVDALAHSVRARRLIGVLPDRPRTFDRLTGRQLLYYFGVLRGLDRAVARRRTEDLARVFGFTADLGRRVSDYSTGMTRKILLAGALIHSPRMLVLDEPFDAIDPESAQRLLQILQSYVQQGGTVIFASHSLDLVQRVCTDLAVIVGGLVLAEGPVGRVRGELTLQQRMWDMVGAGADEEGLTWLRTFSD